MPGARAGVGQTSGPARWQARRLLTAPYRLLFSAAALLWLASALWWAGLLVARWQGWPLRWAVPAPQAHALVMTLGFAPLFFAGFLFTAGPRWLLAEGPTARTLAGPTAAALAGWCLVLPALHWRADAAAAALLPAVGGLGLLVLRLVQLCRRGAAGRRQHTALATAGLALCGLALAGAAVALAGQAWPLLSALLALALWLGVAGVFAVAAHRMSPWLGPLPLNSLLVALAAQGGATAADALGWPPPWPLRVLLAGLLAALALRCAWAARAAALPHGHRTRMLRMLRAGLAWLTLALALAAVAAGLHAGLARAPAPPGWASALADGCALAAIHALALGFGGSHLLTMASRVVAAHGGRAAAATDDGVWRLHLLLQSLVMARVAAALLPAWADAPAWLNAGLLLLAALAWAGLAAIWCARQGHWLGLPPP